MPSSNSAPWRAGVAEQKSDPSKNVWLTWFQNMLLFFFTPTRGKIPNSFHSLGGGFKICFFFFHPYPGEDSQFIPFTRWWFQNMLLFFFTPTRGKIPNSFHSLGGGFKICFFFFHPYPGEDSQFIPFTRWWFQNMLLFFSPLPGGRFPIHSIH